MSTHPPPNGGDKPLGRQTTASKNFVEAFVLFTKYSTQKVELITMMSRCNEGLCKELLKKQIEDHSKYIAEASKYFEIVASKKVISKDST